MKVKTRHDAKNVFDSISAKNVFDSICIEGLEFCRFL